MKNGTSSILVSGILLLRNACTCQAFLRTNSQLFKLENLVQLDGGVGAVAAIKDCFILPKFPVDWYTGIIPINDLTGTHDT